METRLLIGGEQVAGDGGSFEVENPYHEGVVATTAAASAEQVEAAVETARGAARSS